MNSSQFVMIWNVVVVVVVVLLVLAPKVAATVTTATDETAATTTTTATKLADFIHSETLETIAFGSCHKRTKALKIRMQEEEKMEKKKKTTKEFDIWKTIKRDEPDAWLWTGDIVYPPKDKMKKESNKYGPTPTYILQEEYNQLRTNQTIGSYPTFQPKLGIYGIWDDHDYGGNDMGNEMPMREQRRDAFFQFLGLPVPNHPITTTTTTTNKGQNNNRPRLGVYNSIEWGAAPTKVKAILLDTRWHRDGYCIPSVAHRVPLGNAIACVTRWLTAGLGLHHRWWSSWLWSLSSTKTTSNNNEKPCETSQILGNDQWTWFEEQVLTSDAQVLIVASSVQVLTTNPTMESWGHFPNEQHRLVNLLLKKIQNNQVVSKGEETIVSPPPLVLVLSGDVHHAEFLGRKQQQDETDTKNENDSNNKNGLFLEITSSGLTHYCAQPKGFGHLCRPLLETFNSHRYDFNKTSFYIGRNYGFLRIDWERGQVHVNIKSDAGDVVLEVIESLPTTTTTTTTTTTNPLDDDDDDDGRIDSTAWDEFPKLWNDHLMPLFQGIVFAIMVASFMARIFLF